jgi:hypothetical protein
MPKENTDSIDSPVRVEVAWSNDQYVQIATVNRLPSMQDGWYAELDRAGVNRLIKTLRKARDAAYGRDE